MSKMWFWQDSQVGYAYLPKVRGQYATHWWGRVLDMKIPAFAGKRYSFSNLFFYPSHQYRHYILLFFFCQLYSGRYMMPFEETTTAAASSMLGNEYRMSSHRRLLAVIGNHGRSQAFGYEILRMFTDGSQPLFCNIFLILLWKSPTDARIISPQGEL